MGKGRPQQRYGSVESLEVGWVHQALSPIRRQIIGVGGYQKRWKVGNCLFEKSTAGERA